MSRTVRRCEDAGAVSLSAEEARVLDAIDGEVDEQQLAESLGIRFSELSELLEQFAMLGIVEIAGMASFSSAADESVDLSDEKRRAIDDLYVKLKRCDYYELLGLSRDADRKEIKKAYHRLAPDFHPDRFFRKNLGSYKKKIEEIFARLTKAHDTLRYAKRRQAYDDQADPTASNPGVVPAPAPSQPGRVGARATPSRRYPTPQQVPEPAQAARNAQARHQRRSALAVKMGLNRMPKKSEPEPEPEPSGPAYEAVPDAPQSAAEQLRQHFADASEQARERRAQRYVREAEQATRDGDFNAAALALSQAAKLRPHDAALAARAAEASKFANS